MKPTTQSSQPAGYHSRLWTLARAESLASVADCGWRDTDLALLDTTASLSIQRPDAAIHTDGHHFGRRSDADGTVTF